MVLNFTYAAANNVTHISEECPTKFNVVALGHSSLLVNWNPEMANRLGDYGFSFVWKRDGADFIEDSSSFIPINIGQFKMPSFNENTLYQIEVIANSEVKQYGCSFVGKTNLKTNSYPAKPDFLYHITSTRINYIPDYHSTDELATDMLQPRARIDWLPCGKKGYCQRGEIAGTHFSIKYKMIDSKQEWISYEYDMAYKNIYIFPGRIYEVTVTSIYGDYKTDSDPQEIIIMPICSPVQSVRFMSLTNSSILISWEAPKQWDYQKKFQDYLIWSSIFDNNPLICLNYSSQEYPTEYKIYASEERGFNYVQQRISNLIPGTRYTFSIIPRIASLELYGFEYRFSCTPQNYHDSLSLTKPEFDYLLSDYHQSCKITIRWLPCGRTYDCKNTKPGSYFFVKIKNKTDGKLTKIEVTENDWVEKRINYNKIYEVSVESVDQIDQSHRLESELKVIDTHKC